MKCNIILHTAVGDLFLGDRLLILSLYYANQTDNQKHKSTCSLETSTLLLMRIQLNFVRISTIDAVMAVKAFVQEGLLAGEVIGLVSFDVQGAFYATWWPGILKKLRACGYPRNLHKLTKSYFFQHTATLLVNSLSME